MGKLKFAVVCSSNQNRSMDAHEVLLKNGFSIRSFGTGDKVKLPGPTIDRPNVYPFGVPYAQIQKDLTMKDEKLYTQMGILSMLQRNAKIKPSPEKFQLSKESFDVILSCEERCFDSICQDLLERGTSGQRVHVINMDIKDNREEAAVGAQLWMEFLKDLEKLDDLDNGFDDTVEEFQKKTGKELLHAVF